MFSEEKVDKELFRDVVSSQNPEILFFFDLKVGKIIVQNAKYDQKHKN